MISKVTTSNSNKFKVNIRTIFDNEYTFTLKMYRTSTSRTPICFRSSTKKTLNIYYFGTQYLNNACLVALESLWNCL